MLAFDQRERKEARTVGFRVLVGVNVYWDKGLSPEEIQKIMSRANAWFDRYSRQGKVKAGQALAHEGKIVSGKKGRTVTDGPFAESKEAIAGYVLLEVDDLDQAVEIAKGWPLSGNTRCKHRSATGE